MQRLPGKQREKRGQTLAPAGPLLYPLSRLQTRGAERVQLNSNSPSPAGLGAAPCTPTSAVYGGHCMGLSALQSPAGLRTPAMGLR